MKEICIIYAKCEKIELLSFSDHIIVFDVCVRVCVCVCVWGGGVDV